MTARALRVPHFRLFPLFRPIDSTTYPLHPKDAAPTRATLEIDRANCVHALTKGGNKPIGFVFSPQAGRTKAATGAQICTTENAHSAYIAGPNP
jgi:hypothetical protein